MEEIPEVTSSLELSVRNKKRKGNRLTERPQINQKFGDLKLEKL